MSGTYGGKKSRRADARTGRGLAPVFALLVAVASGARARAAAGSELFRFPVVLCDFQYSVVDEQDGYLQLVHRHTGEQIFRVRNTGADRGEIQGEYPIQGTPYRFAFTARIEQGSSRAPHRILLQSRLEKLDPSVGGYVFAGQKTVVASQPDGPDGTILKKVAARALNYGLDSYKGAGGKFDLAKIEQGIRWRQLQKGTVFRAGPVCLMADVETVRQVTSRPAELADVFKRYEESKGLLASADGRQLGLQQPSSAPVAAPSAALMARSPAIPVPSPASLSPAKLQEAAIHEVPPLAGTPGSVRKAAPPVGESGSGDAELADQDQSSPALTAADVEGAPASAQRSSASVPEANATGTGLVAEAPMTGEAMETEIPGTGDAADAPPPVEPPTQSQDAQPQDMQSRTSGQPVGQPPGQQDAGMQVRPSRPMEQQDQQGQPQVPGNPPPNSF